MERTWMEGYLDGLMARVCQHLEGWREQMLYIIQKASSPVELGSVEWTCSRWDEEPAKTTIHPQLLQSFEEGEGLLCDKLRITWTVISAHANIRCTKERTASLIYMQNSTRRKTSLTYQTVCLSQSLFNHLNVPRLLSFNRPLSEPFL